MQFTLQLEYDNTNFCAKLILSFLKLLICILFLIPLMWLNQSPSLLKSCEFILTNDSLFKLFTLSNHPEVVLRIPFLLYGSISEINDDPEDHFNSSMKQSIKISVILNNQTETIAVNQTHRFVAFIKAYLRKLFRLKKAFCNKERQARNWIL